MTFKEAQAKEAEENANKYYHGQGDIYQQMPWSDCKDSFISGSTWAARYILEHEAVRKLVEKSAWLIQQCEEIDVLKLPREDLTETLAAFKELEKQVSEK